MSGETRFDEPRVPAAIRSDIEATRARMGETLEELGARLNPSRLKQEAKDKVRDATIGRVENMARDTVDKAASAGRTVTNAVRENPIPAALIAVGVGWMIFSSRRNQSGAPNTSDTSSPVTRFSMEDGLHAQPRIPSRQNAGARLDSFEQEEDGGVAGAIRDKTSAVVHATQDVAQRAAGGVADAASSVATTLSETAKTQSARIGESFGQNPLAIGAIAVALGVAAGLAVPSTRKESELMGDARDDLADKARDLMHEKKDQVQHVAQRVITEAKSVATQAARDEGLTG